MQIGVRDKLSLLAIKHSHADSLFDEIHCDARHRSEMIYVQRTGSSGISSKS